MVSYRELVMTLKASDLAVLYVLEKLTNGKKRQLQIRKIAENANLSYRSTQYSLDRLVKAGRVKRTGPGARVPYFYEVLDAEL